MRKCYALLVDEYSINQSRECRKEWGTVSVIAFDSRKKRDTFCMESVFRIPISAREAKYYGG